MTISNDFGHDELQNSPAQKQGRRGAYIVCWLLGIGSLFPWNSMLTIEDYYEAIFPRYHSSRVLTIVYQPFALITIIILSYYEATSNTRRRILLGFILFNISTLLVLVLNLATSGKGGLGPFIGVCIISAAFGVADAHVQGGMIGDLSYMHPDFIQSFSAGLAASGTATSVLRLITKSIFESSKEGLRKGALLFFAICTVYVLVCVVLYALVFPRLQIVKFYRSKAAAEGSKTVTADLAAGGITLSLNENDIGDPQRLNNRELLRQNLDYGFDMFIIYVLTLSIFPGFLSEDTGKHQLGSWYAIVLIAMFNIGDLIGRYIPLIEAIKLESRPWLTVATLSRLGLIPCFYFTAKYGTAGWMLFLCIVLGVSNGYLTVCVFIVAPKGYKGPEQNALGNLLVLFVISGLFVGAAVDWLWLIGKGW